MYGIPLMLSSLRVFQGTNELNDGFSLEHLQRKPLKVVCSLTGRRRMKRNLEVQIQLEKDVNFFERGLLDGYYANADTIDIKCTVSC